MEARRFPVTGGSQGIAAMVSLTREAGHEVLFTLQLPDALHREMKDVPAYALIVANAGPKLKPDSPFKPADVPTPAGAMDIRMGPKASMAALTNVLMPLTHRPVMDRTGIAEGLPIALVFGRAPAHQLTVIARPVPTVPVRQSRCGYPRDR
jgi:uncharacterized protein (TIGR03435 family)